MTDMYSHQANTDELTELFNRRYFKNAFIKNLYNEKLYEAKRNGKNQIVY